MMNFVRKKLNDELVYKNFYKRNIPDKDNILQVMLKIMLHKYLKKNLCIKIVQIVKVMLKIYMYRESYTKKLFLKVLEKSYT